MSKTVERDRADWTEPFTATYQRIAWSARIMLVQWAVIVGLVAGIVVLATRSRAQVYQVACGGEARFVGTSDSVPAPSADEAKHVARTFVEALHKWNSSTVIDDVARAVGMGSVAFREQLERELGQTQFVTSVRTRRVRSELVGVSARVVGSDRSTFAVLVSGRVDMFPLDRYAGEPIDQREVSLVVVMQVVPRDPELRLNGLEVVRLDRPGTATKEEQP